MDPRESPVLLTHLVPADLSLHPTFPPQAALRPDALEQDVHFRHSGWLADRKRVFTAIATAFPDSTRLSRFRTCGANAWVIRNEDDPSSYAVASDHCHDRFCQPCANFRGRVIAHNVAEYIGTRRYRFLTVTIKTTGLTLKEGVDKLYRDFAKLRRTKLWNEKVTGGCVICEVKVSSTSDNWHPHLHCIIEGKYLPLKPLRKLWLNITGDSFIIDISLGRDADAAAGYVTKYVTKQFDDATLRNPPRLLQAIEALTGRRLIATFGSWRGQRLTAYTPSGVWVKVAPLSVLREAAERGDDDARAILRTLADDQLYCQVPSPRPRPPPDDTSPVTLPIPLPAWPRDEPFPPSHDLPMCSHLRNLASSPWPRNYSLNPDASTPLNAYGNAITPLPT